MQRRLVEFRRGIEAEVEHLQRQLAAGDDEGPAAGNPALVEILAPQRPGARDAGAALDALVNAGIEDLDDLAFHLEAIGNVDGSLKIEPIRLGDEVLPFPGGRKAGWSGRN